INFEGFVLSTTQMRQAIEQGQYKGWDDIRLPFVRALRRRGYQPAALRKFANDIGLSLNDKTVSKEEFWKIINAFNRELIEPTANRYFFIDRPVKITIKGMNRKSAEVLLHPDHPERGKRTFSLSEAFYISKLDLMQLAEGYVHRLMDCCNFVVEKEAFRFLSEDYESYKNAEDKGRIIHWLPAKKTVQVEVLMDTGITVSGLGEEGLTSLQVGDIIQLERRYFARVDAMVGETISLWYLHK
ncbi:MAG: glutamate--tRNA ligase family protein, partial [Nanoarchaeota archaeon]